RFSTNISRAGILFSPVAGNQGPGGLSSAGPRTAGRWRRSSAKTLSTRTTWRCTRSSSSSPPSAWRALKNLCRAAALRRPLFFLEGFQKIFGELFYGLRLIPVLGGPLIGVSHGEQGLVI